MRNAGGRAVLLEPERGIVSGASGPVPSFRASWSQGPVSLLPGEAHALPFAIAASADAPAKGTFAAQLRFRASDGGAWQRGVANATVSVDAVPPTTAPPRAALLPIWGAGVAAAGLAVGSGALLLRRERWRWALLAPFAALYTRLAAPDLLDHEVRREIHALVAAEPGIHLGELQRRAALPTGALLHHLRMLERAQLVASRREGAWRRFYPAGGAPRGEPASGASPAQAQVLALLREGPLAQPEIARRLGISQQGANHHVKALERRGAVVVVREGRRSVVSLATPGPAA